MAAISRCPRRWSTTPVNETRPDDLICIPDIIVPVDPRFGCPGDQDQIAVGLGCCGRPGWFEADLASDALVPVAAECPYLWQLAVNELGVETDVCIPMWLDTKPLDDGSCPEGAEIVAGLTEP